MLKTIILVGLIYHPPPAEAIYRTMMTNHWGKNYVERAEIAVEIYKTCNITGLPYQLFIEIAHQETKINHHRRSPKGAYGVLQVLASTGRQFGVEQNGSIDNNVLAAGIYLRYLVDKFGGALPEILAAYNAGPSAVIKYRGIPPYKETQNYVRKIMNGLETYYERDFRSSLR